MPTSPARVSRPSYLTPAPFPLSRIGAASSREAQHSHAKRVCASSARPTADTTLHRHRTWISGLPMFARCRSFVRAVRRWLTWFDDGALQSLSIREVRLSSWGPAIMGPAIMALRSWALRSWALRSWPLRSWALRSWALGALGAWASSKTSSRAAEVVALRKFSATPSMAVSNCNNLPDHGLSGHKQRL